jgi:CDP-4-dehydro-6-deoxyglucose reductase, E3
MKWMDFAKPQKCLATVTEKQQLTAKVYLAKYQLAEPQILSFHAGQTIMLNISEGINRAMSIASPPQENNIITSIQDTSPGGPGSKWMEALKVGDSVNFVAPLGRFILNHESARKKVMIATGTGIAPFRSMLLDQTNVRIQNEKISLYWGLRFKEDIYLKDELTLIDHNREELEIFFTLSKPSEDWTGYKGHVTDLIFSIEKDFLNCDYYLCGNKNMITEMTEKLIAKGVPKEQMKFDPFY